MLLYTIELEGDYITFVGEAGTEKEGTKTAHRKSSVKDVLSYIVDNHLTLVIIDNNTVSYDYMEVEDPSTPGIAFVSLTAFRNYMMTNLAVNSGGGSGSTFEVKNAAATSIAGYGSAGTVDIFQQTVGANTVYSGLVGTNSLVFGPPIANNLTGLNNAILGSSNLNSAGLNSSVVAGASVGPGLTGTGSIVLGHLAASAIGTSNFSVIIGRQAANNIVTSASSVFVGYAAGIGVGGTASNSIFLGQNSGSALPDNPSNVLVINSTGTGNTDTAIIYGEQSTTVANQRLNLNVGHFYMQHLPTSDPSVEGRWYTNGVPTGGTPRQVFVSGGAGGGVCITGDAMISINENETVRFDQLAIQVLTFNEDTKENEIQNAREVVTKEHDNLVKITLGNGTILKSTSAHPWKSDKGWVSLDIEGSLQYYNINTTLLEIGTSLQTKDGSFTTINSIEFFTELQTTYHLAGIPNGNYYANGILTPSMR